MVNLSTTKEARIWIGEKTISWINGPGKSGQLHMKESSFIGRPNLT